MEIFIAILLFAASVFLAVSSALRRLAVASQISAMGGGRALESPLLRFLMPACSCIGMYIDALPIERFKPRIGGTLAHAGMDDAMDPSECIALGIIAAAILGVLGGFTSAACAGLGAACGVACPWLWLGALIRDRRREIERDLPNALDMITLSVEAGQDFAQAMSKIEPRQKGGALRGLIERFNGDLRNGKTRREALAALRVRSPSPTLRSIASLLIQADRFGTPVGAVLRAASADLRRERFSRAERAGARASQLILIPLVLFIMPATFIVIFGPLVARFMTGGFDKLFGYG